MSDRVMIVKIIIKHWSMANVLQLVLNDLLNFLSPNSPPKLTVRHIVTIATIDTDNCNMEMHETESCQAQGQVKCLRNTKLLLIK